ncbi:MAG: hypothetical protein ACTSU5_07465 [Promethearchaeota archaeon]
MNRLKQTLLAGIVFFAIFAPLAMPTVGEIRTRAREEDPSPAATTFTLYEAYSESTKVSVNISGKANAGYYGECMKIVVEQLTTTDITIEIVARDKLLSKNSAYQDMVVSKSITIHLTSIHESKTVYVYAFCVEMHKSGPASWTNYSVSSSRYSSTSCIGKILSYCEDHTSLYSDQNAQYAIWACTDGVQDVCERGLTSSQRRSETNEILANSGTGLKIPSDCDDDSSSEDDSSSSRSSSSSNGIFDYIPAFPLWSIGVAFFGATTIILKKMKRNNGISHMR